jgi:hypothetical protein
LAVDAAVEDHGGTTELAPRHGDWKAAPRIVHDLEEERIGHELQ